MKGDGCTFRHKKKGEKSVVCKHWLRGLCKNNDLCEYLHIYDLTKMDVCQFFRDYNACKNGDDCPWLHIKPEDRIKDCAWYARGLCRHGPNCRNRHVPKTACPDYLAGFCILGPNCPIGHPKFEFSEEAAGNRANSGGPACSLCGNAGHVDSQCKQVALGEIAKPKAPLGGNKGGKANYRPVSEVQCYKCGEMGHYADACSNTRKTPHSHGHRLPLLAPGMGGTSGQAGGIGALGGHGNHPNSQPGTPRGGRGRGRGRGRGQQNSPWGGRGRGTARGGGHW